MGFVVLGSVFLAVTGAEALYADMGHFGRKPIQAAWLFVVLPALICNYLGQGALILTDPKAVENPFYLLAPGWGLLPLILLSTAATVIASQAVITGAFSLVEPGDPARAAAAARDRPHLATRRKGRSTSRASTASCCSACWRWCCCSSSSDALANAYGIAVAGTMVMTTSLAFFVVWKLWRWPLWRAWLLIAAFLSIDIAFFVANLYKVLDGGYVPLLLGATTFIVMWTWSRGSAILMEKTHRDSIPIRDLIKMLEKSKPMRVPGTAVFLTNDAAVAPSSFMHNLKHNKVVHERVVMMCVRSETAPRVPAGAALRDRAAVAGLHRRQTALRLHGAAAHPDRAGGLAQARAEVRHHDDFVLPRPPHAEDRAEVRHAEMAGPTVHRAGQTGRERAGLLPHPLRSRRRARRADEGVSRFRLSTLPLFEAPTLMFRSGRYLLARRACMSK